MTAFKNSFVTTDNVENIFYYMLLSCHEFQSEFTLYSLPGCQGTPCSKQAISEVQVTATGFEPTTT